MKTISVEEAKSQLSELISRASSGEKFLVQRRERSLAVLLSPVELERLERAARMTMQLARALGQSDELLRKIDEGKAHPIMAAYGLWPEDNQPDDLVEHIKHNRRRKSTRPGGHL